jgi:hypothetical protein
VVIAVVELGDPEVLYCLFEKDRRRNGNMLGHEA